MTKKSIVISLVMGTMLWVTTLQANPLDRERDIRFETAQHLGKLNTHRKLDTELKHTKAQRRTFHSSHEYKHARDRNHKIRKHRKSIHSLVRGRDYDTNRYHDNYRHHDYHVRGQRHWRNSWVLAYKYERASFYDNEGFFYGYFNHRGYMFEGEFYRYDRYYTYRDRVRGKGLFTRRYFRPMIEYYSYNENDRRW